MPDPPFVPGLHESLVTDALRTQITSAPDLESVLRDVGPIDAPHVLSRHIAELTRRALERDPNPAARLTLINGLLDQLGTPVDPVESPVRQLLRVTPVSRPGITTYEQTRPSTPLSDAALITNAKGDPNLGTELKAEINTADEVDLLCAFVKWHGLRLLEPELQRLRERGAPLRVITTTYMGATERLALDRLVRDLPVRQS